LVAVDLTEENQLIDIPHLIALLQDLYQNKKLQLANDLWRGVLANDAAAPL
jgi:hypothetical protein